MFSAEIDKFIVDDSDKNTLFAKVSSKEWKFANYTILFFIILSIFLIIFESLWNNRSNYFLEIFILDFVISSVFFIEYFYRFKNSAHKWEFPFRVTNVLDLLSFLPFFVMLIFFWVWNYLIFSIFRIFRVFKIFELFQRIPIIVRLFKWIYYRRVEYQAGLLIVLTVVLFSSTVVYYAEFYAWNKESFSSIPASIWWAFVTLSTLWYWDMVPVTFLWRFVWVILMILWPISIAVLSSITVLVFMESTRLIVLDKKIRAWIICSRCETLNSNDSIYCKKCWDLIDNLEVKK